MSRQVNMVELAALGVLERDGRRIVPALCQRLRVLIRSGQLQAGDQLPSSRLLAMQLGISRSSVTSAYEQLIAEGYLDAEHGAGTRVCRALPNVQKPSGMAITAPTPALPPRSASLAAVASAFNPLPAIPFAMAVPCGKVAPDRHWLRLRQRVLASQPAQLGSYGDPQGLPALREALCDYLRTSRAVHCEPDQIILTEGTQQGLYVAAMTLLEPGHTALVEDPAYGGLTALLTSLGITMAHVPVDEQGIDIARGEQMAPGAQVAFVTPSHHYPLGMPLSMPRRLALLAWAQRNQSWIVEDDYDSELRFGSPPFPALQGIDGERIIYLGTFSKVLAPSLRLGYLVAPPALKPALLGARILLGRGSPLAEQHVLAAYLKQGFFNAHLRRVRSVYAKARDNLLAMLADALPWLRVQPSDQGMHLLLWLPPEMDDVAICRQALARGVALRPLSPTYAEPHHARGLLLGFGGFTHEQMSAAIAVLVPILEMARTPHR